MPEKVDPVLVAGLKRYFIFNNDTIIQEKSLGSIATAAGANRNSLPRLLNSAFNNMALAEEVREISRDETKKDNLLKFRRLQPVGRINDKLKKVNDKRSSDESSDEQAKKQQLVDEYQLTKEDREFAQRVRKALDAQEKKKKGELVNARKMIREGNVSVAGGQIEDCMNYPG